MKSSKDVCLSTQQVSQSNIALDFLIITTEFSLNLAVVSIQNYPSVLIKSAVHHEVFTARALEARVRRKIAFRAPAGKKRVMYGGLYEHTKLVLYLLYTQPKISFNYCIIT